MPAARQSLGGAAAACVALALLAVGVVSGALQSIDQYAVDHWMQSLELGVKPRPTISLHQLYPGLGDPVEAFCRIWTYPASAFASFLILATTCSLLVRRGQRRAAVAWAVAWVAANCAEVALKHFLARPLLYVTVEGYRFRFTGFVHAFPSGHAMRAVLVAALLAAVWRRALWPALVWVAVVFPALVVVGAHTVTDVAGGALLGLAVVLAVQAWLRT